MNYEPWTIDHGSGMRPVVRSLQNKPKTINHKQETKKATVHGLWTMDFSLTSLPPYQEWLPPYKLLHRAFSLYR
jgi:hypothetical protein